MQMLSTLGIDWGMMIAQAVNFLVLLIALSYFLYKPVLRVLDERRERVKQSMDHAAALERQVAEMEKDRKKRMQEMDAQMKDMLVQSKQQADETRKELVSAAQAEAAQLLEKGRKQMEDERRKLLADLQKTVTDVSVQLAEKILERQFSAADQQKVLASLEKDIPSLIK